MTVFKPWLGLGKDHVSAYHMQLENLKKKRKKPVVSRLQKFKHYLELWSLAQQLSL